MADTTVPHHPEDTTSVGSRISWGAVLAGAVVTLALYLVLTMLGAAIGLSAGGWTRLDTISVYAMIWAALSTCVALFAGGCVTSMLTAGETKLESVVHGVILWGSVMAILLWMTAAGMQAGFSAMLGAATVGTQANADAGGDWETAARRAGVRQSTIDEWKKNREELKEAANDPEARTDAAEKARKNMAMVTWWSLFGTLLSMGAAIAGAACAAGPAPRDWLNRMGRSSHQPEVKHRETVHA
jgi:hypothetical protein